MMTAAQEERQTHLSNFALFEERLNGGRRSPIHGIRKAAIARFAELGFPTTKDEEWRFTNVGPIAKVPWRPAPASALDRARGEKKVRELASVFFRDWKRIRLVFVNGRFSPELSSSPRLPNGVIVRSLAAALESDPGLVESHLAQHASYRDNAFAALNTAFLEDGAFVHIPKGTVVEEPICLLFVSIAGGEATVSHPRTLVVAGDESQATIVESYSGPEDEVYFTNAVTEIVEGRNATIDHLKLERESRQAFHIATLEARADRSSRFSSNSISFGGALVRNDLRASLDGEGSECLLNGLYMVSGRQHVDNHTTIDHAKPHCASREVYRGILDGHSAGVFNGKIIVRPDAQKTDAKQTNKNLLLSEDAQIDTKPELEIFANDVKCTHGATIGRLDEDVLFYLRSRGIPRKAARSMLMYAFASDIVGQVKVEPVREELAGLLLARLAGDKQDLGRA